jgi:GNAT superfamily N-acetyltransferase
MGITIREPGEGDFFSWLSLYADYATYHGRQLTDQGALVVWSWLSEPTHSERGLVAVEDDGRLIGLVHYHDVPRPLDGSHALLIDDLFVLEEHREQGFGRALIESVAAIATASGIRIVEWVADPADSDSRGFYDELADHTDVSVYRLRSAEGPTADDTAGDDSTPEGAGQDATAPAREGSAEAVEAGDETPAVTDAASGEPTDATERPTESASEESHADNDAGEARTADEDATAGALDATEPDSGAAAEAEQHQES